MPPVSRKGHFACELCRARKLRCTRPLPCTNCISRGKPCHFGAGQNASIPKSDTTADQTLQQQPSLEVSSAAVPSQLSPADISGQERLLEEVRSLQRLAANLENRVTQTINQPNNRSEDWERRLSPSSGSVDLPDSPRLAQVKEMVAHLERVSMVQSFREPIYLDDDIVIKIERIRNIPQAPSFAIERGKPVRCIWLPLPEEAQFILNKFITNVSYIHHVVHHPSLPATIIDLYRQIESQGQVNPGNLLLFLGIVASTTEIWLQQDDVESEDSILPSALHANAQTPLWIKAAMDVLKSGQNGPALVLETIQGIILLSFVLCNTEGVSLRYRSLLSTGLLLSRELGLHRIDHESNAAVANTIRAEVGRRVWWYLVSTDWLLAVLYDGPSEGVYQAHERHMMVKKPRNMNDVDLTDGYQIELPISQPTEMSYFLQRIHMAEIARGIVDQRPMASTSSRQPGLTQIRQMDSQLDQFIHEIPFFFNLDNYENPESTSINTFVHAYLLNLIIHTQRCKLHLQYLTTGPSSNPAYITSREICLNSARQLIRAECQLERAQHPFVLIRLRLSAMLYGVFLASIALLMDAYINKYGSWQDEIRHGDVAEALRIVESARSHSWAAGNLHQSITKVLAKYRAQQPEQRPQVAVTSLTVPNAFSVNSSPVTGTGNTQTIQRPDQLGILTPGSVNTIPFMLGQVPFSETPPPYNELAQSLEELMYTNGFQWDDLLDIHAASFF